MQNTNFIVSGSKKNEINMKGILDYKMLSADEALEDEVGLPEGAGGSRSDDSDNDVYDDVDDEVEAESQITQ